MSDNEYYSGGDSGSDSDSDSEPIHTKGKVDILKKMVGGITIDNDEDNDDDEIEDETDEI